MARLHKYPMVKLGSYSEYAARSSIISLPSSEVPYYDRGAIRYLLHNFYNGCENIFKSIAKFFENDVGPQTWHKDLLKRMRIAVPNFRPQVIDDQLFALLDDFRSFRHKFRHTYAFELDWDRERVVAGKLPETAKLFTQQIEAFLRSLDGIE